MIINALQRPFITKIIEMKVAVIINPCKLRFLDDKKKKRILDMKHTVIKLCKRLLVITVILGNS